MIDRYTLHQYRKFRKSGMRAKEALSCARTVIQFNAAEMEGLVRLRTAPDSEPYEWGNMLDGLNDRERAHVKDRTLSDGVWGVIGEYRSPEAADADDDDAWEIGDSCWGFAGYRDVTDPYENWYVPDIMWETLRHVEQDEMPVAA
jgi:hypothetical protein